MFGTSALFKSAPLLTKETIIIPLGLLQALDHNATGMAFIKLAQEPERLLGDKKLDPTQLSQAMPRILEIDATFRAGKCDVKQFRKEILNVLKLKASDEEFDHAWNAMQGNLEKLSHQLQEIKKQNTHLDIILISKTNPIHINHIYKTIQPEIKLDDEKSNNPLSLLGIHLHVSYHSPGYKETSSEFALYDEAIKNQKLDAKHVTILLQCTSNSPYALVKKRDEEIADGIKKWAESQGICIIDRKPQENITDAIARGLPNQNILEAPNMMRV